MLSATEADLLSKSVFIFQSLYFTRGRSQTSYHYHHLAIRLMILSEKNIRLKSYCGISGFYEEEHTSYTPTELWLHPYDIILIYIIINVLV